jgi:hypothetical protein
MINTSEIIEEFKDRFGEYLEMEGDASASLLNEILACEIIRQREQIEYLKKVVYATRH